jgi:SAM-dependent methyltransferase
MTILNNTVTKTIWHKLPYSIRGYIISKIRHPGYIPPGWIDFGDFRRVTPIGSNFGHDRGKPIDRYYIENFLASNSSYIRGRVLEIEDNRYTLKYGKDKVTKSDILNLSKEEYPATTIEADISSAPDIPSNSFDCIICTQTLQFIYDVKEAINTLHRILKPGGFLLATVPAISQIDARWSEQSYWKFSSASAELLFKEFFPDDKVEIHGYGNILTAVGFLQGLALAELIEEELNYQDQSYEMLITIKAVKNK